MTGRERSINDKHALWATLRSCIRKSNVFMISKDDADVRVCSRVRSIGNADGSIVLHEKAAQNNLSKRRPTTQQTRCWMPKGNEQCINVPFANKPTFAPPDHPFSHNQRRLETISVVRISTSPTYCSPRRSGRRTRRWRFTSQSPGSMVPRAVPALSGPPSSLVLLLGTRGGGEADGGRVPGLQDR